MANNILPRGTNTMSDPNNPSGALPGDPRYGLSEVELEEYYRTKSPCWIIRQVMKPDAGADRAAIIEPHIEYLRSTANQIRFSGPLLDDAGEPCGAMSMIDAPDRASAEAWLAAEPFFMAGIFGEVTYVRWSSSMELRQADYPRTEGWQQFAITAIDGPDADAARAAVADAHHKYQASVMDRYVARGPMFIDDGSQMIGSMMIMEYPDHAACDEFWAGEPLNYGGVFSHVAIERWRYGKSLG